MIYKDELEVGQAVLRIYPYAKETMRKRREYWYEICAGGDPGGERVDGGEKTFQQDKFVACLEKDKEWKIAETVVLAVDGATVRLSEMEASILGAIIYDRMRIETAAQISGKCTNYVRVCLRRAITKCTPYLLPVYEEAREIRRRSYTPQQHHGDKQLFPSPY